MNKMEFEKLILNQNRLKKHFLNKTSKNNIYYNQY